MWILKLKYVRNVCLVLSRHRYVPCINPASSMIHMCSFLSFGCSAFTYAYVYMLFFFYHVNQKNLEMKMRRSIDQKHKHENKLSTKYQIEKESGKMLPTIFESSRCLCRFCCFFHALKCLYEQTPNDWSTSEIFMLVLLLCAAVVRMLMFFSLRIFLSSPTIL